MTSLYQKSPDWFPSWIGETVTIVGAGPSAKEVPLELTRGKCRVIAVNNSYQLVPWADILYACDGAWWRSQNGVPDFKGLKLSLDRGVCQNHDWGVRKVNCNKGSDKLLLAEANYIGWGGNSGFGAINLAVQFGVRHIILCGFDLHIDAGTHWHGDHPGGLHNPNSGNIARWRRAIDGVADQLHRAHVEVSNASPNSRLTKYTHRDLSEALEWHSEMYQLA